MSTVIQMPIQNVMLKSGGPVMSIIRIVKGVALCSWIDQQGRKQQGTFPVKILDKL